MDARFSTIVPRSIMTSFAVRPDRALPSSSKGLRDDEAVDVCVKIPQMKARRRPEEKEKKMTESGGKKQLLHLVFGGELESLADVQFRDLKDLDIVGLYPDSATALTAWK